MINYICIQYVYIYVDEYTIDIRMYIYIHIYIVPIMSIYLMWYQNEGNFKGAYFFGKESPGKLLHFDPKSNPDGMFNVFF